MAILKVMQPTKNNKNLLMHYKGYEEFVTRILDLEEKAQRYRKVIFTPFLSVKEQEIVHQVVQNVNVYEDGGYEGSELKRMAFSLYEEEIVFPIVCLSDNFDRKYHELNHRDVLGAIMNLGVERNVIGDIIVDNGNIFIYVEKEMEAYFIANLNQIKRCQVVLKPYYESVKKSASIEYTQRIVASFRLDVIVASICNLSREKAKMFVKAKKVKVNQVVLEEYDYICNNNSTISIRGYGRFILVDLQKKTKKDRHLIQIGKYI